MSNLKSMRKTIIQTRYKHLIIKDMQKRKIQERKKMEQERNVLKKKKNEEQRIKTVLLYVN